MPQEPSPAPEAQAPASGRLEPPASGRLKPPAARGLAGLVEVTAALRGPGGCPWDADQTHASLVRYLIEECHELVEAIETGDRDELIEELGDVLYQVLFHADLAAHTPGEDFDIDDVADHMADKMVGRHPHVFADREAATADDVVGFWEDLKRVEKPERTSVLDGIPRMMPSLLLADKLLGRAASVGVPVTGERAAGERAAGERAAGEQAAGEQAVGARGAGERVAREPVAGKPVAGERFAGERVTEESAARGPVAEEQPSAEEATLGERLLAIVADARSRGLDAERALRIRLRALETEIRAAERPRG